MITDATQYVSCRVGKLYTNIEICTSQRIGLSQIVIAQIYCIHNVQTCKSIGSCILKSVHIETQCSGAVHRKTNVLGMNNDRSQKKQKHPNPKGTKLMKMNTYDAVSSSGSIAIKKAASTARTIPAILIVGGNTLDITSEMIMVSTGAPALIRGLTMIAFP